MKVLMTADTVGGVWTYALELAGALAPHGVTVALATMGAGLPSAMAARIVCPDRKVLASAATAAS